MLPRNISWGIKAAGSYAYCLEICESKIPGNSRICPGLYRDYFTFFVSNVVHTWREQNRGSVALSAGIASFETRLLLAVLITIFFASLSDAMPFLQSLTFLVHTALSGLLFHSQDWRGMTEIRFADAWHDKTSGQIVLQSLREMQWLVPWYLLLAEQQVAFSQYSTILGSARILVNL
jgi:hypothetical protein